MNLTYKTERCSQTLKANSWLLRRNMRGVWNGYAHTAIFTMDNQPRPTVGHMETCSMLCGSLDERGVWGRIDTCILLLLSHLSCVRLCATPSLGFSRQEHWSGLPFPSPMHKSEKWKWNCSVMSDSSQPHGLQPTRLLHPWDFPGKSTGVGCHCLWMTKSLHCSPETIATLLISYSLIQDKKLKKKSVL